MSSAHSFCTSLLPASVLLVGFPGVQGPGGDACRFPANTNGGSRSWLWHQSCFLCLQGKYTSVRASNGAGCWTEVHRWIKQTHHGPNRYPALDLLRSVLLAQILISSSKAHVGNCFTLVVVSWASLCPSKSPVYANNHSVLCSRLEGKPVVSGLNFEGFLICKPTRITKGNTFVFLKIQQNVFTANNFLTENLLFPSRH